MDEVASVATVRAAFSAVDRVAERLVLLTEALTADQLPTDCQLSVVERLVPGYIDYVRQSSLRAARLAQTVAEGIERVYASVAPDDFMVFHFGIEAPLALARTDLELLGRIGAMVRPADMGLRAKSFAGLLHYDLNQLPPEVMRGDTRREDLEASVEQLESLTEAEPNRWRGRRERQGRQSYDQAVLAHWNVSASVAMNYLSKPFHSVYPLYQRLSAAVHGGALLESVMFRQNERGFVYGYILLRDVSELLRSELDDLSSALTAAMESES